MKKLGKNTEELISYLRKAGWKCKRFIEHKDGEISYSENSYEDVCRVSQILRIKGFSNYEKVASFYKDVRSHYISDGQRKIIFKTDSSTGRTNISIEL